LPFYQAAWGKPRIVCQGKGLTQQIGVTGAFWNILFHIGGIAQSHREITLFLLVAGDSAMPNYPHVPGSGLGAAA